jgi:hypothetical protein
MPILGTLDASASQIANISQIFAYRILEIAIVSTVQSRCRPYTQSLNMYSLHRYNSVRVL